MNLKEKIRDNAKEIQLHTEKISVLANYMIESDDTNSPCYTMAYFIDLTIKEIQKIAEKIELCSFKIKDDKD